jgi:hypothetical protein
VHQGIKHNRFYVDLDNIEDVELTLVYFQGLAKHCSFPVYATLQQMGLNNDGQGFRVGVAHDTEQAIMLFPTCWAVAVEDKLVPSGNTSTDEITVTGDIDWVVKDINPGLMGDYNQYGSMPAYQQRH